MCWFGYMERIYPKRLSLWLQPVRSGPSKSLLDRFLKHHVFLTLALLQRYRSGSEFVQAWRSTKRVHSIFILALFLNQHLLLFCYYLLEVQNVLFSLHIWNVPREGVDILQTFLNGLQLLDVVLEEAKNVAFEEFYLHEVNIDLGLRSSTVVNRLLAWSQSLSVQFAVVFLIGLDQKEKREALLTDWISLYGFFIKTFKTSSEVPNELQVILAIRLRLLSNDVFETQIILDNVFDEVASYFVIFWQWSIRHAELK